jgi:DNA-directed RNA polymerase subunit alpha
MFHVPLPQPPQITSQKDNKATFVIEGLYPGYGITIANAFRRVILSSLPGAAVVAVKIKDIDHEFSTIPGVLEDVIVILLHIKKMRFLVHEEGLFEGHIKVKGEKEVKAGDFTFPSQTELVNPDLHIASLTDKKAELEISVWITQGTGYHQREARRKRFAKGYWCSYH